MKRLSYELPGDCALVVRSFESIEFSYSLLGSFHLCFECWSAVFSSDTASFTQSPATEGKFTGSPPVVNNSNAQNAAPCSNSTIIHREIVPAPRYSPDMPNIGGSAPPAQDGIAPPNNRPWPHWGGLPVVHYSPAMTNDDSLTSDVLTILEIQILRGTRVIFINRCEIKKSTSIRFIETI